MGNSEVNYSLGVLIVLLLMFWFVCKCIGKNDHVPYRPRMYMRPPPIQVVQPMKAPAPNVKAGGMLYGGTKVKIGTSGSPHIGLHKGVVEVPNSKTASRELMSNESYKCNDSFTDNELSSMYMKKRKTEKYKSHPRSLTNERHLRSDSFNDLKPMGSY
jgi:hypothetical protein